MGHSTQTRLIHASKEQQAQKSSPSWMDEDWMGQGQGVELLGCTAGMLTPSVTAQP